MKLLTQLATILLFTGVVATSCKKEIGSGNNSRSSERNIDKPGNKATPDIYTSSYEINYTSFNPCTGEDVAVSGSVKYRVTWVRVGNKLNYTYHFGYDKVKGVGLTTGTRYNCSGHISEAMQATVVGVEPNVSYELRHDNITNKIQMTAPAGKKMVSTASYKVVVKNGVLLVDKSHYEWDACK